MRIIFVEDTIIERGLGISIETGRKAVLDKEEGIITLEQINPVEYIIEHKEELRGGTPMISILMGGKFSTDTIPADSYIRLKPGF